MSKQTVKLNLSAAPPSIEERDGAYFITQSTIPFAAVILRFQEGLSPDTIRRECYPSLPLSHVYSAITYYLNNSEQVEGYLQQIKKEEDELQAQLLDAHPDYINTAEEFRNRMLSTTQK